MVKRGPIQKPHSPHAQPAMKNSAKLMVTLALGFVTLALPLRSSDAATLTLDQNFRTGVFSEPAPAERTLLLPDGKFLLFNNTDTLTDQPTGAVTRYLSNGALDTSFHFSRDYKFVAAAASVANGKVVIAATRYTYGAPTEEILRLNSDGTIDTSF